MYAPQDNNRFLRLVLIPYHFSIIIMFAVVYAMIGLKEHFGVTTPTSTMPIYFSMVTHSSTGYGDITPKTDFARAVVTAHLALAWIPTLIVAIL